MARGPNDLLESGIDLQPAGPPMPLPLALLPAPNTLRLTPTDVSQFVRLDQCERYLRFRLGERAGQDFMGPYGVVPQRLTPLLSMSGGRFESEVESALAG